MERQLSLIHILFSNQVLREFFLPELKKAAAHITVPWIFHSDGNLLPALEDLDVYKRQVQARAQGPEEPSLRPRFPLCLPSAGAGENEYEQEEKNERI